MCLAYPCELEKRERERLKVRQAAVDPAVDPPPDGTPRLGVALSGGGIRSATFALGFFQGLASERLLRHVDYVSTVSGGGYFGAFLGRLFTRGSVRDSADVERVLAGGPAESAEVRWLREHGRYLAPTGSGDLLLAGAVYLRNWVAVQVVIATFVVLLLVALQLPALAAERATPELWRWWADLRASLAPGALVLSPYLPLAALVIVFGAAPIGWAYWLVGRRHRAPLREVVGLYLPPALLAAATIGVWLAPGAPPPPALTAGAVVAVLTLVAAAVAAARYRSAGDARNGTSRWLKAALLAAAALLSIGAVDSIGATLYLGLGTGRMVAWVGGAVTGLAAASSVARRIVVAISPTGAGRPKASQALIAGVAALVLVGVYLSVLALAAQAAARGFPSPQTASAGGYLGTALLATLVLAVTVALLGGVVSFLNRSSHHALYMARLTRAYLGASNTARGHRQVLDPHPDDDAPLDVYYAAAHHERGMPIHLVNMTINETIDGRSQVQQQDRKGTSFVVGPCGLSVGVRHHAVFTGGDGGPYVPGARVLVFPDAADEFRVFEYAPPAEGRAYRGGRLSLGGVVAISGAAFTTGLGYRTSLALSLLLGLANLRLGYWWDSGVSTGDRAKATPVPLARRLFAHLLPLPSYLLGELLARFRGTAWRHWYLSDGGHFENLGAYELIRRRLRWMLVLDAEADADYAFEGLANLVHKARVDFGAEIRFLDEAELDGFVPAPARAQFGPLASLRRPADPKRPGPPLSGRHFALADVAFADGSHGWLIYAKPSLTGDEPPDLVEYLTRHPAFPHEPTSDQFFDERQWESYRALGAHLAKGLVAGNVDPARPWRLGNLADPPGP